MFDQEPAISNSIQMHRKMIRRADSIEKHGNLALIIITSKETDEKKYRSKQKKNITNSFKITF